MVEALKEKIKIHFLTPKQLLDKHKNYLDYISTYFKYKGLKKDDVYNQAYLELLEIYLQTPEITDKKLKNKVTHKLRNNLRKEIIYRKNNTSLDTILDDEHNDSNKIDKQMAKQYLKVYNRSIPFDALNLREEKIVRMYYFFGYKEKEIANYYNLSHQRINKIKSRALKKMKNALL